jgi:hypothetical protein
VQKDPLLGDILNLQILNRYVYCQNIPINAVDPTGNRTWKDIARGIGFAIFVGGVGCFCGKRSYWNRGY